MHKYASSLPPAVFVGRMLLRPYRITGMESEKSIRPYSTEKSEIKKQERIRYPCRGVLHTPYKYPIKNHYILHKYTSSPPPAAFVGRIQYAPTMLQEWNP